MMMDAIKNISIPSSHNKKITLKMGGRSGRDWGIRKECSKQG
jgi:hypothetical protein